MWYISRLSASLVGRSDPRTVGRTDGRTVGRTDRWTVGRTDGWTDRRTDGRSDGRLADGRTDGRTDYHESHAGRLACLFLVPPPCSLALSPSSWVTLSWVSLFLGFPLPESPLFWACLPHMHPSCSSLFKNLTCQHWEPRDQVGGVNFPMLIQLWEVNL